jgi:signal transduction histidine kinase
MRHALGIPLELKLLGANLIILAVAALAHWGLLLYLVPAKSAYLYVVGLALAAGGVANFILVRLALRSIADLQRVAKSVASGRLGDRVPPSLVADRHLAELAVAVNEMLDTLAADRERMRKLATEVVYAQESERAQIERDLQDTVGRTLSAASFQLTALANEINDRSATAPRLAELRELLRTSIEEIARVSRSLHPRVADDLGLPAALESLAQSVKQRSLLNVTVTADIDGPSISSALRGTLYHVAEEALRDIESHANSGTVSVLLYARPGVVELEVTANESGSAVDAGGNRRFSALDAVRERLALAGGELRIDSNPSGGTRILARIKTEAAKKTGQPP